MTHAPASAQQLPAVSSSDTQQQLHKVIATCRAELAEHYAVVQQEKRRKLQRWYVAACQPPPVANPPTTPCSNTLLSVPHAVVSMLLHSVRRQDEEPMLE